MSEEDKHKLYKILYYSDIHPADSEFINNIIYDLQQENKHLKDLYRKTCNHLFNIGNDELARYFQAQINETPIFTTQILEDK